MGQLAMSAAGAAIGFVITGGNPMGVQIGWALGPASWSHIDMVVAPAPTVADAERGGQA